MHYHHRMESLHRLHRLGFSFRKQLWRNTYRKGSDRERRLEFRRDNSCILGVVFTDQ